MVKILEMTKVTFELTKSEFEVLKKLLGNLSDTIGKNNLDLSDQDLQITTEIWHTIKSVVL